MNAQPVVVEQTYDVPVDVVWSAITDKNQMRQWFFEPIEEFEPVVDFETRFDVECEGECYPHLWKVTEVEPGRRIAYQWRYGGYPGDSTVVWELTETSDGTNLKLSHVGHESFPQDNAVFSRDSCQAGWEYFLRESLSTFLKERGE